MRAGNILLRGTLHRVSPHAEWNVEREETRGPSSFLPFDVRCSHKGPTAPRNSLRFLFNLFIAPLTWEFHSWVLCKQSCGVRKAAMWKRCTCTHPPLSLEVFEEEKKERPQLGRFDAKVNYFRKSNFASLKKTQYLEKKCKNSLFFRIFEERTSQISGI